MSNQYDDSKFGVIKRKWFGLTKKWGGDCADGYAFSGTTAATTVSRLARWYPRGPIKMLKFGVFNLATVANAESTGERYPARLLTRGASASVGAVAYGREGNQAVFASSTTFTVKQVKAGEYISIKTGTWQTDAGTAAVGTLTGTIAFFVDYVPSFDASGKWDVTQ